jgi:hypothetical protein
VSQFTRFPDRAKPAPIGLSAWQKVWREGVAPELSTPALLALRDALVNDSPELCQLVTTQPPPMPSWYECDVCAACLIAFAGWQGEGLSTVEQVEEFFARVCDRANVRLGEEGAVRYLLGWFDLTPRERMRVELFSEVELALTVRGALAEKGGAA